MSSNAGGFGRIKFENAAALDAWKKSKVSHADFEDWPETFVTDRTKPFVIEKKLAELAKPRSSGVLDIAIDANSAELIMDVEEETFNDHVGEIATLFRASAAHGGKGTIVFLGTAGAEEDFAFELLVDKKKSRVSELSKQRQTALYRSATYRAFQKTVGDELAKTDPLYAKAIAEPRKPTKTDGDVDSLFATFEKPADVDGWSDARRVLAKKSLDEIERPLVAALAAAAKKKPDKNLSTVVMCDATLVELARTAGAQAAAKALAALATSKRAIEVRKPAAELLLDWELELGTLAKFEEPSDFGIGAQVARARFTIEPEKTLAKLVPITKKNSRDVFRSLQGLDDDARSAKKAKRKPLIQRHRDVARLIDAARDSGDEALGELAKRLARSLKR